MRGDIVARLPRGIVAQAMRGGVEPARRPLGTRGVAEADGIGGEQFEQRHGVGRSPFARCPCLVPADRPRGGQPDQRAPAADVDRRDRARRVEADAAARPVGQASPPSRPPPGAGRAGRPTARIGAPQARPSRPAPVAKPRPPLIRWDPRDAMPAYPLVIARRQASVGSRAPGAAGRRFARTAR